MSSVAPIVLIVKARFAIALGFGATQRPKRFRSAKRPVEVGLIGAVELFALVPLLFVEFLDFGLHVKLQIFFLLVDQFSIGRGKCVEYGLVEMRLFRKSGPILRLAESWFNGGRF